ncbi:MAG: SDR family oxidoreductase [Acidobacteria bacterium]|nr:SDR family oxidoreductase [Acidobacteriota bacterium]
MLDGRVVMVSGVGPGLGGAIASAAASSGARVALLARRYEVIDDIKSQIRSHGGEAICVPTDITSPQQCDDAVSSVMDHWGRIDGLVNNAFQQPPFELLEQQSLDTIREGFEVNLFGHLSLTKSAAPALRDGGGSVVMTLSSILRRARPNFGAYKMAKHALLGLTRALAVELGSGGIRVNAIAPGYIYDEPVKAYFAILAEQQGRSAEEVEAEITATHPLGFIPTPAQIAKPVLFLLSELAEALTGQCLDVNGGEFMV